MPAKPKHPREMAVTIAGKVCRVTNAQWIEDIQRARLERPAGLDRPVTSMAEVSGKLSKRVAASLKAIVRLRDWQKEMRDGPGVFIPIYLRNPLNRKQYWALRRKDVKAVRDAAFSGCAAAGVARQLPVRVRFTRYGPRRMDPQNVMITLKPLIDGIADYFGPDDGEPCYEWVEPPGQEKSPPGCYGVRIEFEYPKKLRPVGRGARGRRGNGAARPAPNKPTEDG